MTLNMLEPPMLRAGSPNTVATARQRALLMDEPFGSEKMPNPHHVISSTLDSGWNLLAR